MMNERIRELAEQATDTVEIVNPDTGITHHREFFDKEKFAHLLMREIMRVQVSYQTGMDLENKKMDNPAKELTRAVIEHFGVEE
jgi:hypothetical protein